MAFNRSLLHEERIKRGLTTYQLAEKVGVSQGTISKWEIGMTQPKGERMKKLCDYFDVEPDYWDHFYHEPQKPLESFRPSEEAKKAYKQAVDPHEADKEKVRENLTKLKNGVEREKSKTDKNTIINSQTAAIRELNKQKEELSEYIGELEERLNDKAEKWFKAERELNIKETEIQGMKCELEGLKVENARLKGVLQGIRSVYPTSEPIKPTVTYTRETSTTSCEKEPWWKRMFG